MVTIPCKMVGLERMLDYRGVGLQRFNCTLTDTRRQIDRHTYTYCMYHLYACTPENLVPTVYPWIDRTQNSMYCIVESFPGLMFC